jgi:DNA-binding transcriptional MerR regulator
VTQGNIQAKAQALDLEWVRMIAAARNMGLTTDEVRAFLKNSHRESLGLISANNSILMDYSTKQP